MTVVTDNEVERVARALRVHRWKTKAWPTSKPPEPKNFVFLPCDLSEARAALAASDRDVLVAENQRLREALKTIADDLYEPVILEDGESFTEAAANIARAALLPLGGG